MGDTWSFSLFTRTMPFSRAAMVRRVIELLLTTGFTTNLCTPYPMLIFDNVGEAYTFSEMDVLISYLATEGGLVTPFWYYEEDIGLRFDFSTVITISLEVGYTMRERHCEFVTHLLEVYAKLCDLLALPYGCVFDEWGPEARKITAPDMIKACLAAVEGHRPVPFLFWVNYFSNAYLDTVGLARFGPLMHTTRQGRHGQLLFCADWPWEAEIAVLTPNDTYRMLPTP